MGVKEGEGEGDCVSVESKMDWGRGAYIGWYKMRYSEAGNALYSFEQ